MNYGPLMIVAIAFGLGFTVGYREAKDAYNYVGTGYVINRANIACTSTGGVSLSDLTMVEVGIEIDDDHPWLRCNYDNTDRRL